MADLPSRIYLVEDFVSGLPYHDGLVVSLTPDASYALGRLKIPYKILTDYVGEAKLREGERQFLQEQLQWVHRFDLLIRRHVRFCEARDIDVMRLSIHHLKYFIDTVIIQVRTLRYFLESLSAPGHLIYVRREKSTPVSIQGFSNEAYSALYPLFLPQLCHEDSRWSFEIIETAKVKPAAQPTSKRRSSFLQKIAVRIKLIFLRLRFGGLWPRKYGQDPPLNLFFVHFGSAHLDIPIRQLCARGHSVFLRCRDGFLNLRGAPADDTGILPPEILNEIEDIKKCLKDVADVQLAQSPEGRELTDWVNRQSGLDVTAIVLPALQEFAAQSGSEILTLSLRYQQFYLKNKIDYVLTHAKTDAAAKAAFVAAGFSGVKKVVFQHGCQLFHDDMWNLTDFDLTDVYFCSDPLSQTLFTQGLRDLGLQSELQIYQSPHYLRQFQKKAASRPAGPVRKVLYLPTKLRIHAKRFNLSSYPATWYFEYQKNLIEYFGTALSHCTVTYKQAIMRRRYADDALVAYLNEKKYANIHIDCRATLDCIRDADVIITDRPTTAFFEAVAAKKPILVLYPQFAADLIEPKASGLFKKSLYTFTDAEDAFKKIGEFVSGDPAGYAHEISLENAGISANLCRIKEEGSRVKTMNILGLYLKENPAGNRRSAQPGHAR